MINKICFLALLLFALCSINSTEIFISKSDSVFISNIALSKNDAVSTENSSNSTLLIAISAFVSGSLVFILDRALVYFKLKKRRKVLLHMANYELENCKKRIKEFREALANHSNSDFMIDCTFDFTHIDLSTNLLYQIRKELFNHNNIDDVMEKLAESHSRISDCNNEIKKHVTHNTKANINKGNLQCTLEIAITAIDEAVKTLNNEGKK